jgi:hypothetical protein
MTYALWIVQGLLALLFLFAGGTKLILSLDAPEALIRLIRDFTPVLQSRQGGRGQRASQTPPKDDEGGAGVIFGQR